MDHTKTQKGNKPGADGLSKKERRALRVEAAGGNDPNKKNAAVKKPEQTNPPKSATTTKVSPVKSDVKIPLEPSVNKINVNKCSISQHKDELKSNKIESKAEAGQAKNEVDKAQRRAFQQAQRLSQVNAKNNESQGVVKEATPKEVTEKSTPSKSKETLKQGNKESGEGGPSKAELKAQRRAVQEAQRLAKAEQVVKKQQNEKKVPDKVVSPPKKAASPKKDVEKNVKSVNKHKVSLFNHLYFEDTAESTSSNRAINVSGVHTAFLRVGAQYSSKTILGSNARCLALLSALKSLISAFSTPPKQEFCRSLESSLQLCVAHVNTCRPLAVSMTNALRHFKLHLTQIDTNLPDAEKRSALLTRVDTYIQDEIAKAGEAISIQVSGKISNSDVILTYGCSSLITKILLDAHEEGKTFKVIVVDGRPLLEGREMLRKLVCAGIQCTYVLINAASFVMSRVTKVVLGAHALLANGYVMSRTGTAQVALIANAYKKPVLVCCETYKFSERVQTDSFVYNEIGEPDKLIAIDTLEESSPLKNWRNSNYLTPLNLMYDVTPPDLVTAVVTELAFLPCTSVPVILRIRPTEIIA